MADTINITTDLVDGVYEFTADIITGEKGDKGPKGDTGPAGTTDYNLLENKPDLSIYEKTADNDTKLATKASKSDTYTKIEVDTSLSGKADEVHVHSISDVTNLQSELDKKANSTDVDSKLDLKADKTELAQKIADLVNQSPETLNTLAELANALGNDPNFATTIANQIGTKANSTDLSAHISDKNNPHAVTKAQVGLDKVDNTADVDKPVSTATQNALNNKSDFPTANSSVPVRDASGLQGSIGYSQSASTNSIARRGAGGVLEVGAPTATTHATTKAYVDSADATKVNKAGDTMTGELIDTLSGLPFTHRRSGAGSISFGVGASGEFAIYNNDQLRSWLSAMSNGLALGDLNGIKIIHGNGSPEGVTSAVIGSIYIDKTVTNGQGIYFKAGGTSSTGWRFIPVSRADDWSLYGISKTVTSVAGSGVSYIEVPITENYLGVRGEIELQASGVAGFSGNYKLEFYDSTDTIINTMTLEQRTTSASVTSLSLGNIAYTAPFTIGVNGNARITFTSSKLGSAQWCQGSYQNVINYTIINIGAFGLQNAQYIRKVRLTCDKESGFTSARIKVEVRN